MASAEFIKEVDEFTREYRIPSGAIVRIKLSEDWSEMIFTDRGGNREFGEFEFQELESGDYKLMRMYTNQIKGSGIGRAALEFFKEVTNALIYTSPNDGIVRDDGSHLTEDAPGFVRKMMQEGLIAPDEGDENSENGFLYLR